MPKKIGSDHGPIDKEAPQPMINAANETIAAIRAVVAEMFGKEVADKVRIQYGGSVKPNTIKDQMAMSDIDGALVGGASLVADDFSKIVNF